MSTQWWELVHSSPKDCANFPTPCQTSRVFFIRRCASHVAIFSPGLPSIRQHFSDLIFETTSPAGFHLPARRTHRLSPAPPPITSPPPPLLHTMTQATAVPPPTNSFNRMAISTIAPSACDTILPPMRLFGRRSVSPASSDSDGRGNSLPVADTGIHPHLSSDVSGLHQADATIVPSSSSNGRQAPNGLTNPNPPSGPSAKAKGKGKAKEIPSEDWLQPPGRKLCFRHQRMADEGTNLQLQMVCRVRHSKIHIV